MRYLSLISGTILFLLALGFALKNSDSVTLNYFLGYQWQAPLILILMVAFCLGTAAGIAATLGLIFRQRREIQKLRREIQKLRREIQSLTQSSALPGCLSEVEGRERDTQARSASFKPTERTDNGI